jgi:phage shock protein E
MLKFLKSLFGGASDVDFKNLIAAGAVVVDVRTPEEFKSGHVSGSINIPLDQIASKLAMLKNKKVPIIAVCRSGARSGAAVGLLKKNGVEAYNAGPWNRLHAQIA